MKTKSKVLISSLLVIALCVSLIAGTTFALFTSEDKVNIAVTSGKVSVEATLSDPVESVIEGSGVSSPNVVAELDGNSVALNNMTPGDRVTFTITVENKSTVAVKYRTKVQCLQGVELMPALDFTIDGEHFDDVQLYLSSWANLDLNAKLVLDVVVEFPSQGNEIDNIYQGITAKIAYSVEAVQANGQSDNGIAQIEKLVSNEEQLRAAVQANVTDGSVEKIVLTNDIALGEELYLRNVNDLVIDGNGHTITALPGFAVNTSGQRQLVKIQTEADVTLKNVILEHIELPFVANTTYHTLDIWGSNNVTLEDVTVVRDVAAQNGGAPVVLNDSNVTVLGDFNVICGGSAWGGVNVDASELDITGANVVLGGKFPDVNSAEPVFENGLATIWTENEGTVVFNDGQLVSPRTEAPNAFSTPVLLVTDEAQLLAAVEGNKAELVSAIILNNDIALSKELYLKDIQSLVIDGNGHTITALSSFAMNLEGQWQLVKIETESDVTLKNITLKHIALQNASRAYHTLDVYGSSDVTLQDVTIVRDFASAQGGAPMVLNSSNVKALGKFEIVGSGSAWYGADIDNSSLNVAGSQVSLIGVKSALWAENGGEVTFIEGQLTAIPSEKGIAYVIAND